MSKDTSPKRKVRTLDERIADAEALVVELKQKKTDRDAKAAEKERREAEKKKSYTDEKEAKRLLKDRKRLESALETLDGIGQGASEAADDLRTQLEVIGSSLTDLEE